MNKYSMMNATPEAVHSNKVPDKITIAIAASGTGGHLLPAISIARALEKKLSGARIIFIGSTKGLESKLIGEAGYELCQIPYSKVKRMGFSGMLSFLASLPGNVFKTWSLLRQNQVRLVIGVGGYVSVLPVIVACLTGRATMIHEAERHPGLANKVLKYFAKKITTAHEDTDFPIWAPTVFTGHPLRLELLSTDYSKPVPNPPLNLLIIGGSLGANSLDHSLLLLAPELARLGLKVRHQCRSENQALLEQGYKENNVPATVATFINAMEETYKWADIVIARAGAGLVRELELAGRPAILIPLPNAQEQLSNANDLAKRGQAIVVQELESRLMTTGGLPVDTLVISAKVIAEGLSAQSQANKAYQGLSSRILQALQEILSPANYEKMAQYLSRETPPPDPSAKIADIAIRLLKR
jgi:UDP-N-acetylglucosamine--N-acetylmuramyl-(pentapeptide) pyrophosphoryl-undecaprenol N-acetylglucosamine transferase